MLLKLLDDFMMSRFVYKRRAIFKIQKKYCEEKYKTTAELNIPVLTAAQKETLYNNIKNKTHHKKLFRRVPSEKVSIKDSSIGLKHGNIPAKREAALCFLQDSNLFTM
ncbi:hypothetical protein NGRA_0856 [Nosema granulosis]|uniref:Uncharacterized protein n=1 Tax=Nosema granulosis TaxID=83296 RepID=A0A9P6GZJ5_9MICR|nr:hypothetical protein NGRA_0856 [Nosema granulosis]